MRYVWRHLYVESNLECCALLTDAGYELRCRDVSVHLGFPVRRRIIERADQE
jgi:hypothetical protein